MREMEWGRNVLKHPPPQTLGSTIIGLSAMFYCPTFRLPSDQPLSSLFCFSLIFASSSSKKGFSKEKRVSEKATYEILKEEYRNLGPFSFAEVNITLCFFLLVFLWFSRDPGFIPGWASITWVEGKTK